MENATDGSSTSAGVRIYIDEPERKAPIESNSAPTSVYSQKQSKIITPQSQHQRNVAPKASMSTSASSPNKKSTSTSNTATSTAAAVDASTAISAAVTQSPKSTSSSHNGMRKSVDQTNSPISPNSQGPVSPALNSFAVTVVQKQK